MGDKPTFSPDGTYVLNDAIIQSIEETSLTGIIKHFNQTPEDEREVSGAGQAELENPVLVDDSFVDRD